ncbi:MAG: hypothetical protein IPL46_25375 [Saprospiraceae bacterium]|nr:hypothetical protein [Saprospiraceae bacterium]
MKFWPSILFFSMYIVAFANRTDADAIRYVRENLQQRGFQQEDIKELIVSDSHYDQSTGLTHFYIQQHHLGYPIEGALVNVVRLQSGKLKLLNHTLIDHLKENMVIGSMIDVDLSLNMVGKRYRSSAGESNRASLKQAIWIRRMTIGI